MEGTTFLVTHPMLPSLDLERTSRFYQDHFGFSPWKPNDEVVVLSRDRIELHFWKCEDENIPANSGCRIQVSGIEALYAACQQAGLEPGPLEGKPPGRRVFGLNDPDGNALWIFQLPDAAAAGRKRPA
jgi:catechol 2,3-dioxygenase-like lactoylglutathione lyase family enzyme